MAGTIVTDRIESDASYASSITVASPMVVSNTLTMGSAAAISGNVNIDSGLLFVDGVNNRVGIGGITNPALLIEVGNPSDSNQSLRFNFPDANTAQINSTRRSSGSLQSLRIAGQDTVQLLTNGTERVRVDIEGRVTKPNQPAFRAVTAGGTTSTTGVIAFASVPVNTGSHFSTVTNRFTAPVAGRYLFCGNIYVLPNTTNFGLIQFRVNGGQVSYSETQSTATTVTLSFSIIVSLSAGDYTEVAWSSNGGRQWFGGPAETNFSGYLIG
jgi:hypothetical protein